MENINKLSVPVILWLIGKALDDKKFELVSNNKSDNNEKNKHRMIKTVGGGSGLWGNIAQLILIPGVFILCSIGLKNVVDKKNSGSNESFLPTFNSNDEEDNANTTIESSGSDYDNDQTDTIMDDDNNDNNDDDDDDNNDNENAGNNDDNNDNDDEKKRGGFIRDGSTQFFTHLEKSKINCAPNSFYNLTNQHTQKNIPPKDFSSVNSQQQEWASDPSRW